jgi:regulator of protease activity HflC (stomatin/prohibitin superfamily)
MYKEVKKKIKDLDPEVISWQREDKIHLEVPLLYIFPQPGDKIKDKKYFAVKNYEKALFYNKGEMIGVLGGGIYELDKNARIKGTEIVWVDATINEVPWGIAQSEGLPTKDGYIVGLYGNIKLRINDAKIFYNDIVAGKKNWMLRDLKDWIMSLLHTSLRDIFKKYNAKEIILEERERVINLITSKISEEFTKYGLEIEAFNIIGIKPPEDIESLYSSEKEKTETLVELSKMELEKIKEQKIEIQNRIKELKAKLKGIQDQLIDNKITNEQFEAKKEQIQKFLNDKEEELKKVNQLISKN